MFGHLLQECCDKTSEPIRGNLRVGARSRQERIPDGAIPDGARIPPSSARESLPKKWGTPNPKALTVRVQIRILAACVSDRQQVIRFDLQRSGRSFVLYVFMQNRKLSYGEIG